MKQLLWLTYWICFWSVCSPPLFPFLRVVCGPQRQVCSHEYQPHPSLLSSTNFVRSTWNGMGLRQTPEKFPATDLQVECDSPTTTLCTQKNPPFHPSIFPAIQIMVFHTEYKCPVTDCKKLCYKQCRQSLLLSIICKSSHFTTEGSPASQDLSLTKPFWLFSKNVCLFACFPACAQNLCLRQSIW